MLNPDCFSRPLKRLHAMFGLIQEVTNPDQLFPNLFECVAFPGGRCRRWFRPQMLSCPFYGEFFYVEQVLDDEDQLDILPAIHALAGLGPFGLDALEFGLPESKHMGLHPGNPTDLTNFEIDLVGEFDLRHIAEIGHRSLGSGDSLGTGRFHAMTTVFR